MELVLILMCIELAINSVGFKLIIQMKLNKSCNYYFLKNIGQTLMFVLSDSVKFFAMLKNHFVTSVQ